jgi:hypothetical protein
MPADGSAQPNPIDVTRFTCVADISAAATLQRWTPSFNTWPNGSVSLPSADTDGSPGASPCRS